MGKLEKVTCTRCAGSGHFSFNLKDGTRCYGCDGRGFILADPVKLARNKAARERRAQARSIEIAARVEAANRAADEREAKYKDDCRIGTKTKQRCEQYPAVAYEIYKMLHDFDRGFMDNGRQVHPANVERLAE